MEYTHLRGHVPVHCHAEGYAPVIQKLFDQVAPRCGAVGLVWKTFVSKDQLETMLLRPRPIEECSYVRNMFSTR